MKPPPGTSFPHDFCCQLRKHICFVLNIFATSNNILSKFKFDLQLKPIRKKWLQVKKHDTALECFEYLSGPIYDIKEHLIKDYNLQVRQIHFTIGQIHFTIWTNAFYNLDKYILQLGQIQLTIWVNTVYYAGNWNLEKNIFTSWQMNFSMLECFEYLRSNFWDQIRSYQGMSRWSHLVIASFTICSSTTLWWSWAFHIRWM